MAIGARGLRRALTAWQSLSDDSAHQKRLLRRGISAITSRSMRLAYTCWMDAAFDRLERLERLRRGLTILTSHDFFRAMYTWKSLWLERNQMLRLLLRGVSALVQYDVKRAILTWVAYVEERERRLAKLLRVFDPNRRLLGFAFITLIEAVESIRQKRRAMAGFLDGRRLRAINAWKWGCVRRKRQEKILHRSISALVFNNRSRALQSWIDYVRASKGVMLRLRLSFTEWRGASFRRCWFTWLDFSASIQTLRSCVVAMRHRHIYRAITTWAANANRREIWRERLRRARLMSLGQGERSERRLWRHWKAKSAHGTRIRAASTQFARMKRWKAMIAAKGCFVGWLADARCAQQEAAAAVAAAAAAAVATPVSPPAVAESPDPLPIAFVPSPPPPVEPPGPRFVHVVHHYRGLDAMDAEQPAVGMPPTTPAARQHDDARFIKNLGLTTTRSKKKVPATAPSTTMTRPRSARTPNTAKAKPPPKPRSWSTAATRAKARVPSMVPLDLGAAYVHQLEEAQMLAAVRWRNKYEGMPPPLARALESADAFNRMFENGDNVVHTGSRVSAGGAAQSSRPPARARGTRARIRALCI